MKCDKLMRLLLIVSIILLNSNILFSQSKQAVPLLLNVGDKMPDYIFRNLTNYPSNSINSNAFKGKILIIDFWSTYCSSCIESWPKLVALQNKYKDKLQFMLVNSEEGEGIVKPLFELRERTFNFKMTLPSVCGDSVLNQFFPHQSVPHVVWIGLDGKIAGITDGDEVNEKNISDILADKFKPRVQKVDIKVQWDPRLPLFKDGNASPNQNPIYQSVFSKFNEGLPSTAYVVASPKVGYLVGGINIDIRTLMRYAFFNQLYKDSTRKNYQIPLSRTKLNFSDTTIYVERVGDRKPTENLYTYQYWSDYPVTKKYLLNRMRNDLCNLFNLEGRFERVKKDCLILSVKDSTLLPIQNQLPFALNTDGVIFKINSVTTSQLIAELEDSNSYYLTAYPFVDESNYKGKLFGIEFEVNVGDYKALNKKLNQYGLELAVKERETDIFVISDTGEQNYYFNKSGSSTNKLK